MMRYTVQILSLLNKRRKSDSVPKRAIKQMSVHLFLFSQFLFWNLLLFWLWKYLEVRAVVLQGESNKLRSLCHISWINTVLHFNILKTLLEKPRLAVKKYSLSLAGAINTCKMLQVLHENSICLYRIYLKINRKLNCGKKQLYGESPIYHETTQLKTFVLYLLR